VGVVLVVGVVCLKYGRENWLFTVEWMVRFRSWEDGCKPSNLKQREGRVVDKRKRKAWTKA
jgi:hypothetical protein